jgi:CheY-like chemotaxis protein
MGDQTGRIGERTLLHESEQVAFLNSILAASTEYSQPARAGQPLRPSLRATGPWWPDMTPQTSVLIVDDDAGMVDTLADIFAAKGYGAGTAYSGEAALALSERTSYDVILMDVQMPNLNGVQVLKTMRARQLQTPVIMMTAFTRHELVQEAACVASAILSKPLELDDVLALIDRTVGSREQERDA